MRRALIILLMGSAVALAACGGNRPQSGRQMTAEQRVRLASAVRELGSPRGIALMSVAHRNLKQRNYGNAIQAATLAIESGRLTDRGKSICYSIRGLAYAFTRRLALSQADVDEALRLDPRNITALNTKAGSLLYAGQYAVANVYFSRSIAIKPTGIAHYGRAYVRARRGQIAAALSDLRQSIALNPNFSAPYSLRGQIEYIRGHRAAARKDFETALRKNPNDRAARSGLRALAAGRKAPGLQDFRRPPPTGREGSI